ncbi:RNA-binding protein 7 [Anopheles nili]|uniref:RNA-binding protein 7 n=1 Tax=Anopheles nili TaxID=185578 RepID=UPI00237C22A6|nr:RNA-binding protein 7 [Anopheles nili]
MSEDDRTLYCGNVSEKVTEEMLYELFLQAGPVENVKIPRDADKRQRSYSFITYTHACSVEYAMKVLDGTSLFQRMLKLDRKTGNGPNCAASPLINFKNPTTTSGNRFHDDPLHDPPAMEANGFAPDASSTNERILNSLGFAYGQAALPGTMNIAPDMFHSKVGALMRLGPHLCGAELAPYDDQSTASNEQQTSLRTKMLHNDRSHYPDRHQKPYSRDDRYRHSNDRHNDSHSRHRYDKDSRRNSNDRDHHHHSNRRRR